MSIDCNKQESYKSYRPVIIEGDRVICVSIVIRDFLSFFTSLCDRSMEPVIPMESKSQINRDSSSFNCVLPGNLFYLYFETSLLKVCFSWESMGTWLSEKGRKNTRKYLVAIGLALTLIGWGETRVSLTNQRGQKRKVSRITSCANFYITPLVRSVTELLLELKLTIEIQSISSVWFSVIVTGNLTLIYLGRSVRDNNATFLTCSCSYKVLTICCPNMSRNLSKL